MNEFIPAQPEYYRCKLNYIPADNLQLQCTRNKIKHKFYKLSWWEKESFFKYDSLLISAFYGMKWKTNFRKFFNIPDSTFIMGDSGGFQNLTQNANLNCLEVLRWQENNCDSGFVLDYPLLSSLSLKEKKEYQHKTIDNAIYMHKNRKNDKFKLYAVVHGHNEKDVDYMIDLYKNVIDISNFDGIGVGVARNVTNLKFTIKLIVTMIYKLKTFNKNMHLFGISGLNIIPLIAYLQTKVNFNITFDSSSYGCGAIRKEYWVDYGRHTLEFSEKNMSSIKNLPCNCPVCSTCTVEDMKKSGSISGGLIYLHNLYQITSFIKQIYSLVNDNESFFKYIKLNYKEDYLKYFDYIDMVFEKGLDDANKKYGLADQKERLQKTIWD